MTDTNLGLLERAMNCYSGAKKRRRLLGRQGVRNPDHVTGGSLRKFRIAAIDRDAGDALFDAQILVAFAAELALSACPLHPRHADAFSYFDGRDRRTPRHHSSYNLVPENQRLLYDARQLRPIAVGHMQNRSDTHRKLRPRARPRRHRLPAAVHLPAIMVS
jgi:hypothetical protein